MKTYTINLVGLGICTFDKIDAALNEIKMHLEEMGDDMEVRITTKDISDLEYSNLPEFQGY